MKVITLIKFLVKCRLLCVSIDKDGCIKHSFRASSLFFLVAFLALSGYYSFLRISSLASFNFNAFCYEMLVFQVIPSIILCKCIADRSVVACRNIDFFGATELNWCTTLIFLVGMILNTTGYFLANLDVFCNDLVGDIVIIVIQVVLI